MTEVRSLCVKTSYQPVNMLIQAPLPEMIKAGKVDLCPCDLCNLLVQGEFMAVISCQGLKLAKGIGFNVPKSSNHSLRMLIGQFANDDFFNALFTMINRNDFWSLPKIVSISKW